ncbi:MAG: OmpA family protein [Prevotellaceae bacterium]|nr:OmpA family protein [Prevotellaceae bacterium]
MDKCPDTPTDAFVDNSGCPVDTDSDGVPDYLDKCPNTPAAAIGFTDADGCPKDTDGDGVYDFIDKCPNTPTEASVDNSGCPVDTDGDGIPDYLDKCPNTPRDAVGSVDANGCPKDADGDAVPDYLDKCPEVPGVKDNNGCPELKAAVKRLFKQALQGIQFETGKEVIRPSSYAILNQVVEVMKENSDFLLNIAGHTDNVGQPAKNQELSERRAASVKNYLISKGVEEARLTSEGFGDARPVATNQTAAGRKTNRRVEFTVIFER